MLGDAGANALGALLGARAAGLPRPARVALLAGIAGLTAASEKVSFTKVIERTPALRWLDMLGRRPGETGTRPSAAGRVTVPVAERGSARQRGRGDRPGRGADRRHHRAGPGDRVRPPGGVRAHRPGTTCLGTAYTTANMVPNIIYDIVAAAR
jgi:hypothetical protein